MLQAEGTARAKSQSGENLQCSTATLLKVHTSPLGDLAKMQILGQWLRVSRLHFYVTPTGCGFSHRIQGPHLGVAGMWGPELTFSHF